MKYSVKILVASLAALVLGTASQLPLSAEPPGAVPKVEVVTNAIGMKLARIPAGEFVMGSPASEPERQDEEFPHEVVITRPFYMGVYEVTQREFEGVMGNKQRAIFNADNGGGPDHPMEDVLWQEAVDFCKRLSEHPDERRAGRTYRLPTEAEWEYACRAGTTTAFSFGNALSSKQANFNGNYPYGGASQGPYLRKTAKVGSYEPNAFGLYDMHGNVCEWCADWYDEEYYRDSPEEDPLGPPVGAAPTGFGTYYLVARGGCWLDDARACRSAYRFKGMPKNRYRLIGFRVVCEVNEKAGN
jgi:formylglycine-generating enzyme required for sulfatase activity